MSIIVEKISKFYGTQSALHEVSFNIKSGEIVGFIGPNGAGKSTLMKIISGFLPPSSGCATVNGYNVMEQSLEVRRSIGYLPEQNPLYNDMYIKEYLEFVGGIYKIRNCRVRIKEMIHLTGLEREQHKKIGALSKGYRQRVGLAQALIHDPSVLILDEPTSGLDPNQIVEIRGLISEAGRSKTIILSTHIMQEVEAICHKILIINKGEIVADENTKDIYQRIKSREFSVLVELNREIEESFLLGISNVQKVLKVNEKTWILSNFEGNDFREDVFNYAVRNNLSVLSMHKSEKSLEEVFRELTK